MGTEKYWTDIGQEVNASDTAAKRSKVCPQLAPSSGCLSQHEGYMRVEWSVK